MTLRRLLLVALLCVAAAVGITLLVRDRGGAAREATGPAGQFGPIAIQSTFAPRVARFGDTINAWIDVTVDRRRVQPGSVRVRPQFAPWSVVASPVRVRRDTQSTSYIRTTYVLRCVISPCVPQRGTSSLEFDPVRVAYTTTRGQKRTSDLIRWPVLVIHSQMVSDDYDNPAAVATPGEPTRSRCPQSPIGSHPRDCGSARSSSARCSPSRQSSSPCTRSRLVRRGRQGRAGAGAAAAARARPRPPRGRGAGERRRRPSPCPRVRCRGDGGAGVTCASRGARRSMAWSEDDPAVDVTRGLAGQIRAVIALDEPKRRRSAMRIFA